MGMGRQAGSPAAPGWGWGCAAVAALALLACVESRGQALVKCVDAKGRVSYGNDPKMDCPNRRELDPGRLGSSLTAEGGAGKPPQAPVAAPGSGPKVPAEGKGKDLSGPAAAGGAPKSALDRISEALGGRAAAEGAAPDPTAKAVEEIFKQQ